MGLCGAPSCQPLGFLLLGLHGFWLNDEILNLKCKVSEQGTLCGLCVRFPLYFGLGSVRLRPENLKSHAATGFLGSQAHRAEHDAKVLLGVVHHLRTKR